MKKDKKTEEKHDHSDFDKLLDLYSPAEMESRCSEIFIDQTSCVDFDMHRIFPVRIYLGDNHHEEDMVNAIGKIFDILDSVIAVNIKAEYSSWFKRWFGLSKKEMKWKEFDKEISKVKRALELKAIEETQGSVNKSNSEAFSLIVNALDSQTMAVVQIGNLLIIKTPSDTGGSQVISRMLSTKELHYLEKNQFLLKMPECILEELSKSVPKKADILGFSNRGLESDSEEGIIQHDNEPKKPAKANK